MLVSENLALIIFGVILLISGIMAWWMGSYNTYDKGSFHTFIAILAGLGVFVTFMFYYNVVSLQNQQQQLAAAQELARINDSVLNSVLDEIKNASVIIPNFVLSITPLTNTICCTIGVTGETGSTGCSIPVESDPINPQTCTAKMILSYRIFSLWQDVIMFDKFIDCGTVSYIANFLQKANSSQLFVQWNVGKINFDCETQKFGDLLFEYGLPITTQTSQEYNDTALKFITDPRYKTIINKK